MNHISEPWYIILLCILICRLVFFFLSHLQDTNHKSLNNERHKRPSSSRRFKQRQTVWCMNPCCVGVPPSLRNYHHQPFNVSESPRQSSCREKLLKERDFFVFSFPVDVCSRWLTAGSLWGVFVCACVWSGHREKRQWHLSCALNIWRGFKQSSSFCQGRRW